MAEDYEDEDLAERLRALAKSLPLLLERSGNAPEVAGLPADW
jgi:hypothetical protein